MKKLDETGRNRKNREETGRNRNGAKNVQHDAENVRNGFNMCGMVSKMCGIVP